MKYYILLICTLLVSSCATIPRNYEECNKEKVLHPLLEKTKTGVGIQMHTHQTAPIYADLIKEISPEYIRQDWFSSEGTNHHDYFVNLAESINSTLIFIVKGENIFTTEFDPEILKSEVAKYKGKKIIWELENEPDGFWTPEEYYTWATSVSSIIKKADPNACVIGPAIKGISDKRFHYLETLVEMGFSNYVDGISFHCYYNNPESSVEDFDRLKKLLCDTGKPFLVSEGGPSNNDVDPWLYLSKFTNIVEKNDGIVFIWYAVEGGANFPLLEDWERTKFSYDFENFIESRK